jgi:hypothetical protein
VTAYSAQTEVRNRRARDVRARTISVRRLSRAEIDRGRALYPVVDGVDADRPRTRGECMGGPRPCPFVSCRANLYLDVHPRTGAIKLNFPDLEVWELEESCALDVADRGDQTLGFVGRLVNVTRERVRQLELLFLAKLGGSRELLRLAMERRER